MSDFAIETGALTRRFGAQVAVDGIDLRVARGSFYGFLGENGAGKSTLLKVLAGVHEADAGSITLDGVPFRPRDPIAARRWRDGTVRRCSVTSRPPST